MEIMDLKSRVTENILGIFNNRCEMAKKKKKISKFNTPIHEILIDRSQKLNKFQVE